MLLQAQGNGDSPAGLRLQRLCTELVSHVIASAHRRNICTQNRSAVPACKLMRTAAADTCISPAAQITVTAAMLMHDPTTKGRLHCMPLMSQPVSTPLAPPDSNFWHRVTVWAPAALCTLNVCLCISIPALTLHCPLPLQFY